MYRKKKANITESRELSYLNKKCFNFLDVCLKQMNCKTELSVQSYFSCRKILVLSVVKYTVICI